MAVPSRRKARAARVSRPMKAQRSFRDVHVPGDGSHHTKRAGESASATGSERDDEQRCNNDTLAVEAPWNLRIGQRQPRAQGYAHERQPSKTRASASQRASVGPGEDGDDGALALALGRWLLLS